MKLITNNTPLKCPSLTYNMIIHDNSNVLTVKCRVMKFGFPDCIPYYFELETYTYYINRKIHKH